MYFLKGTRFMTTQEILEKMQNKLLELVIEVCEERIEMNKKYDEECATEKTIVNFLKELQQYRKVGTVEECREMLKKQIEMDLLPPTKSTFTYRGDCPECSNRILLVEKYCSQCGQKLKTK